MLKKFYAIVTQYDCAPMEAARFGVRPDGPILYETYLGDFSADQDAVRARAKNFSSNGWVRVAEVTVDIPDDAGDGPSTE